MSNHGHTKLVYSAGITEISVEMEGEDLDYSEFMELVETLISSTAYSKHEIESYILEWAADIKSAKEN